ncbi:MAG TPA: succinylglutamate desuccinylase, partial [Clostridiales bacterium]|nr:succinylglutamate desuccinylase [Clostridiales bacterium]
LEMEGIEMSLEPSPTNLHGLSHRELGDYTDTYPILMEAPNASQGRLRGATNEEMALTGKDKFYVSAAKLGFVYVPYDENGHPIEERVGRHL